MTAADGPRTAAAVLVAAGSGERLGASMPKAFCPVAGRPLLAHALQRFCAHPGIGNIVVVAPETHLDEAEEIVRALAPHAVVVPGGLTRAQSVAHGVEALRGDEQFVLVHDVARPFVPERVITDVIAALRGGADAVVPVVPIRDTVRTRSGDGSLHAALDRDLLVAMQTPQGFRRDLLATAHEQDGAASATDDASLVERLGVTVVPVPGADEAFKITTPLDLEFAEAVARRA